MHACLNENYTWRKGYGEKKRGRDEGKRALERDTATANLPFDGLTFKIEKW